MSTLQRRIQGRGPGSPGPSLRLDQTETRRAEKNLFWDRASPLSQGLDDRRLLLSEGFYPPLHYSGYIFALTRKGYPVECEDLADMCLSALEIGAMQLRPVKEIAPKSPFLFENRSPIDPVWFSCRRKSYPVWCEVQPWWILCPERVWHHQEPTATISLLCLVAAQYKSVETLLRKNPQSILFCNLIG